MDSNIVQIESKSSPNPVQVRWCERTFRLNNNNDQYNDPFVVVVEAMASHNLFSTHSSKLSNFNGGGVKYKLHTYITTFKNEMKLCTVTNYYNIFKITCKDKQIRLCKKITSDFFISEPL